MKNTAFLFLIFIITLASCDGRDRIYLSNKTVLEEHNLLNSFLEQVEYTPKKYTEIETDTLLNNQFNIKVKYFSLDDNQILKTHKNKENSVVNHYYKNFEALLKISKKNTVIKNIIINKHLFSQYETKDYWLNAIMQFVWVDYEKTTTNSVNLNVSFCTPNKNQCKDYTIIINENGEMKIEKTNLTKDII